MSDFFTRAYSKMPAGETEAYHRAVIMSMDTQWAADVRREYYKSKMRYMGENVHIGAGVKIQNPEYISLGDNTSIDDNCALIARSEHGIELGCGVNLKWGVYLDTENTDGYIEIGDRAYVGTGCCLHGHKGLEIGEDTLLAQQITITPYSHKFEDPDQPIIKQGGKSGKLTIGRDCYIGMEVCILPGGDIGDGAVVGSGAVVVQPVAPFSVAVGVPARVIRKRG